MKFSDVLHKLDAYPKTDEDIRVRTVSGAAVTLISTCIVGILILSEILAFLQPNVTEELFVDTTRGHKLKINLDFTMHKISCSYLSLDAEDSAGDSHLHIEHSVFKRRLDLNGNALEELPIKQELSTPLQETTVKPTCGSCYGAESNTTKCCNSCDEIIQAYRAKNWNPNTELFEQCKENIVKKRISEQHALSEGCQVYGHMEVNRMGGSFHIAPGKSFSLGDLHLHVHDIQPFSATDFNLSHNINHLSFGDHIEVVNTHPLDGMKVVTKEESIMMFQYYIKIVPTLYIKKNGESIMTNQFSVTRNQKSSGKQNSMPGIFFSYELSPLMVKYTEKDRSIGHLATNVCSIIGGVFTVAGIIVALLHNSLNVLQQKFELGKLN